MSEPSASDFRRHLMPAPRIICVAWAIDQAIKSSANSADTGAQPTSSSAIKDNA